MVTLTRHIGHRIVNEFTVRTQPPTSRTNARKLPEAPPTTPVIESVTDTAALDDAEISQRTVSNRQALERSALGRGCK